MSKEIRLIRRTLNPKNNVQSGFFKVNFDIQTSKDGNIELIAHNPKDIQLYMEFNTGFFGLGILVPTAEHFIDRNNLIIPLTHPIKKELRLHLKWESNPAISIHKFIAVLF